MHITPFLLDRWYLWH